MLCSHGLAIETLLVMMFSWLMEVSICRDCQRAPECFELDVNVFFLNNRVHIFHGTCQEITMGLISQLIT
jgi:hypothetical protein